MNIAKKFFENLKSKNVRRMKTKRMTSQKVIDALLEKINIRPLDRVLEPSAGHGILADGIKERFPQCLLDCVELNRDCRQSLKEKGHNVVGSDFFRFQTENKYNFIIACPNFRDNIDCRHIMHMYDQLKSGGEISSLTSPFWMTGDT